MRHVPTARLLAGLRLGKHGGTGTPLYAVWCQMLQRCLNPRNRDYPCYGRRGIKVCLRWRRSFDAFRRDLGPRPSPQHTIDRIDSDGPYCPSNVQWATPAEQAAHRRKHCPLPGQRKLPFETTKDTKDTKRIR